MKHIIDVRIYYEDTDAGGIVYYANYLKFAERGRTELLRQIGFENTKIRDDYGAIFVVRHIEIDYLKPAVLDDALQLETSIIEFKNSSFIMRQNVVRDGEIITDMRVTMVCIDAKLYRPVRLPENVKEAFQVYVENVE
ncbi:MAG: tol-pal system-associated acyl-CoA thioesterase [Zetaproteobacteria bacterium]|nr:MAG: tol-pal system-associated acyl-CoA thioesterase [Zetaproteobacteria bacterium]